MKAVGPRQTACRLLPVQIPAKMVTDDNRHDDDDDDDDDDDEDDDDTHDSDFLTRTRMVTRLVMTGLVQSL